MRASNTLPLNISSPLIVYILTDAAVLGSAEQDDMSVRMAAQSGGEAAAAGE